MIPEPDNIYIVDQRMTKRARRLVIALNRMEANGQMNTKRYADLKAEFDRLTSGEARRQRSGVTINVPRL